MDKYVIESKLYVEPTKGKVRFKILLNFVLLCIAVVTFFYLIFEGLSITKIGELCLAILVVSYYNVDSKPRYQFSILNLEVSQGRLDLLYNAIKMGSYTGTVHYEIVEKEIDKVEYSKQLNAIKISVNISRIVNRKIEKVNELVVYCNDEAQRVIASIENNLGCKVILMEA